MQKFIVLFLFFILGSSSLSAQSLDHVLGDILVRPVAGEKIESIISEYTRFEGTPTRLSIVEQVSKPLNIWLLHFDYTVIHEQRLLRYLQANKKIQTVQLNRLVTMRETIPNDTFFDEQWQYINMGQNGGAVDADIDAELAWDITTGGVTVQGDTIVVAVLDDGVDLDHEDFGNNLWINHNEIPENGIDDDNNGYVDDYLGWNINSNNDNVEGGGHGTPVAGIVGAQGNNDIGVTGVNWNVKIMIIRTDFSADEASVLEAYSYALESRMLYNESDGEAGAFVVSTNASWGIDFGQPEDAPLWCAFYDSLGQTGILNCGATINGNQNVDEIGDLPTACPSDYMIAVTNMNRSDNKVTQAGYGAETIDLGAFGSSAFTTADNNSYDGFGGTSGATPHVTGAIALLYSAPCENLIALAKADPAQAALLAKQYIFDGVDPNASLDSITTTGGRLNIFNALQLLIADCATCQPPFGLDTESLTDTSANLTWLPGVDHTAVSLRWRPAGADSLAWIQIDSVVAPYFIDSLEACTFYEFQTEATCDTLASGFSVSHFFQTDGCCTPPSGLTLDQFTQEQALVSWNPLIAAQHYNIELTSTSGTTYFNEITATELIIANLEPCQIYSVAVQTVCEGGIFTTHSEPITFTTSGCGPCLDLDYCESDANAGVEWIESIEIGEFSNVSGNNDGYRLFPDLVPTFTSYNTFPVVLTPAFSGFVYNEYFKIWIDFNQDGVFNPTTELAFDGETAQETPTTGLMLIPGDAMTGATRMRVSMEWESDNGQVSPDACGTLSFGEVEDYCIEIVAGEPSLCDLASDLDTLSVQQISASLTWLDASDDHIDHTIRIKRVNTIDWLIYSNVIAPLEVINLVPCMDYEFQVKANCADGVSESEYTESYVFKTRCNTVSTSDVPEQAAVSVYPNPFTEACIVSLNLTRASDVRIQLIDLNGRILHHYNRNGLQGQQQILLEDLEELPNGIYYVQTLTEGKTFNHKVVKASE
jgi:subtilisin family serine protease